MAFNVRIYDLPAEPALELLPQHPKPPQTLDELMGVGIVFKHTNRFLYPGNYVGEVTDYRYIKSRSNPIGWLEVKVKSPSFSIEKWVPEENFLGYAWEFEAATITVAAL